jgi:heme-degrading monooxygenase HmoA
MISKRRFLTRLVSSASLAALATIPVRSGAQSDNCGAAKQGGSSEPTFCTLLMIRVPGDTADAFTEQYIQRRIIPECAETIPGFLHGELMKSDSGDGLHCVMCQWGDKASYGQWVTSPVREKQGEDMMAFLKEKGIAVEDMHTMSFDRVQIVPGLGQQSLSAAFLDQ